MIAIDAGVVAAVMTIVGAWFLGVLIAQVILLYEIDDWLLERIYRVILFLLRGGEEVKVTLSPGQEKAVLEMARTINSLGLTREDIEQGSRRLAELSRRSGL